MMTIQSYAFLKAHAEIVHGSLKHTQGTCSNFFSNTRFQVKDCRWACDIVHYGFEIAPHEKNAHKQIW